MAKTTTTLISIIDAGPPPNAPEVTATVTPEVPLYERPLHELTPEQQVEAFVQQVYHQRAEAAKEPPPPPPLTLRQRANIEAEQSRGKAALEKHASNLEAQRSIKVEREPEQSTNTPVFRPEDYVPNMSQGQKSSASARAQNI